MPRGRPQILVNEGGRVGEDSNYGVARGPQIGGRRMKALVNRCYYDVDQGEFYTCPYCGSCFTGDISDGQLCPICGERFVVNSEGGEMEKTEDMAYIARKDCGCIVAAAVDAPESRKDVAKEVRKWIAGGLTVERVTCGYVRQNMRRCPHK